MKTIVCRLFRGPHRIAFVSFLATCFAVTSYAQTSTFQDGVNGYSGTEDNILIAGSNANNNYGGNPSMLAGYDGFVPRRNLLRFDLSSLSLNPGESVSSASITLNLNARPTSGPVEIGVYEVIAANAGWVEGSSNGAIEAGASSWNYLSTGATPPAGSTTWDGGSNGALEGWPGSVSPMDVATITTTTALGTKITFDLSPAVVEGWINNPGSNGGVVLSSTAGPPNSNNYLAGFDASEDGTVALRPSFEVSVIPEPGSASLLGGMVAMGVVLLGLRRRRS